MHCAPVVAMHASITVGQGMNQIRLSASLLPISGGALTWCEVQASHPLRDSGPAPIPC